MLHLHRLTVMSEESTPYDHCSGTDGVLFVGVCHQNKNNVQMRSLTWSAAPAWSRSTTWRSLRTRPRTTTPRRWTGARL